MNDGDVGIWCGLGKNVFASIPLVIFLGSPMVGPVYRGSVFSVTQSAGHKISASTGIPH